MGTIERKSEVIIQLFAQRTKLIIGFSVSIKFVLRWLGSRYRRKCYYSLSLEHSYTNINTYSVLAVSEKIW